MTGEAVVLRRLAARAHKGGIVGVNVGANKDAADRMADYVRLIEVFAPVASYFTVNVSSPNTPGLRDLQHADALDDLLARVVAARDRMSRTAGPTPVLLKIAPDLSLAELDDVVGVARARRVDGMIVGNTTVPPARRSARAGAGERAGRFVGPAVFALSTRMLAETYVRVEGAFPLVGVGGMDSGAAPLSPRSGREPALVQLYSGLIFRGLGIVAEIKAHLVSALRQERFDALADLVGTDAAAMTAEDWPD